MIESEKPYYPRVIDSQLEEVLKIRGAVLVEGIKWSGKTTSAKRIAGSLIDLSRESEKERAQFFVKESPDRLFNTPKPILVDEWQKVSSIWDAMRNQVDQLGAFGYFLLTGSTSQEKAATSMRSHSGTGRIGRIRMHTMSLWESHDSTGEVSLGGVLNGVGDMYGESKHHITDIAYLCARGGWPGALHLHGGLAVKQAYLYVDEVCESDIRTVDGHRRSALKMRKILQSYARHSA